MKYDIEYTDTFGGEANYCWVKRLSINAPSDKRRAIVRAAKAALALTGHRCKVYDNGDMIEIRPYRTLTIAFVTPVGSHHGQETETEAVPV
jgi:hypothetical protein